MENNPEQFTLSKDKKNYADLSLEKTSLVNELLPTPPQPLDTSSVIICHFDFYNSTSKANIIKGSSSQSLNELASVKKAKLS